MSDVECPYCNHEFYIDYDDGHGCEELETYEEQCPKCKKYFVFTTWIDFHHTPKKADCLNGGQHDWMPTRTVPKKYTKMQCTMCDEKEKRIEELEDREKHLLQVIYSVSKVSFEAGACFNESHFHSAAVEFANRMRSEHMV